MMRFAMVTERYRASLTTPDNERHTDCVSKLNVHSRTAIGSRAELSVLNVKVRFEMLE
jgi:hypothetical protein